MNVKRQMLVTTLSGRNTLENTSRYHILYSFAKESVENLSLRVFRSIGSMFCILRNLAFHYNLQYPLEISILLLQLILIEAETQPKEILRN